MRVIEFRESELEQVDESGGAQKKRNDSIQRDSCTTVLPGSDGVDSGQAVG